jgi:hypothetical protein
VLAARWVATGSAAAAVIAVIRGRYLRWGATEQETKMALPGDHLLPDADLTATRAVTVHARADAVWPWIAQLGQGRGGFYSYDFLENLVGCQIHSADRIVAEWQRISVGDQVRLHPEVGLTVALAEPGRALVLRGGVPMGRVAAPYDTTWAFVVCPEADGTTRLVVRERYAYLRWWAPMLVEPTELISTVMSQRMLRGVRERAQRASVLAPDLAADLRFAMATTTVASPPPGLAVREPGGSHPASGPDAGPPAVALIASPGTAVTAALRHPTWSG